MRGIAFIGSIHARSDKKNFNETVFVIFGTILFEMLLENFL